MLDDLRPVVEAIKVVFPKAQGLFSLTGSEILIEALVQARPHFFLVAGGHHPTGPGFGNPLTDRAGFAPDKKKGTARGKNPLDLRGHHAPVPFGLQRGEVDVRTQEVGSQKLLCDVIAQFQGHAGVLLAELFHFLPSLASAVKSEEEVRPVFTPFGQGQKVLQRMAEAHISGIEKDELGLPTPLLAECPTGGQGIFLEIHPAPQRDDRAVCHAMPVFQLAGHVGPEGDGALIPLASETPPGKTPENLVLQTAFFENAVSHHDIGIKVHDPVGVPGSAELRNEAGENSKIRRGGHRDIAGRPTSHRQGAKEGEERKAGVVAELPEDGLASEAKGRNADHLHLSRGLRWLVPVVSSRPGIPAPGAKNGDPDSSGHHFFGDIPQHHSGRSKVGRVVLIEEDEVRLFGGHEGLGLRESWSELA